MEHHFLTISDIQWSHSATILSDEHVQIAWLPRCVNCWTAGMRPSPLDQNFCADLPFRTPPQCFICTWWNLLWWKTHEQIRSSEQLSQIYGERPPYIMAFVGSSRAFQPRLGCESRDNWCRSVESSGKQIKRSETQLQNFFMLLPLCMFIHFRHLGPSLSMGGTQDRMRTKLRPEMIICFDDIWRWPLLRDWAVSDQSRLMPTFKKIQRWPRKTLSGPKFVILAHQPLETAEVNTGSGNRKVSQALCRGYWILWGVLT